ncbi:MAG: HpcH/HpaI aldolase family protein [Actinomycetota bacterium]
MLENAAKSKLRRGETVVGCFVRYSDPSLTEFISMQGWDFLIFDAEHGTLEPREVEDLCRAAELRGATPIARVPSNQPHLLLRYLDTGIQGVHVPWVNTATEAAAAVAGVKYGPTGVRGLAGTRASDWGMSGALNEYTEFANRETLLVIHIETEQAVAAIDDYLAIDGIDVLFMGPTDLSQSIGVTGQIHHPRVRAAMEQVASAVVGSDKALGLFAGTVEMAREWQERGARYIATGTDGFLRNGMSGYLNGVRQ